MQLANLDTTKTMTSLEVAELTNKNHADVMRDCRNMFESLNLGESSFAGTYKDIQNKVRPLFVLPYSETMCLVTGYDPKVRMAVIQRWQELESKEVSKLPTNFKEALLLLVAAEEEKEQLQQFIAHQAHKLDESSRWASVKRMEAQHHLKFNWRELKKYSVNNGYSMPKITDANYPAGVSTYHEDVWHAVYQVEILAQSGVI